MPPTSRKLGAIATGHPETTRAARIILEEGGNAFDAAIGAMVMASVCEPVLSSLGGGGFMLARPEGHTPILYDFFAQTPVNRPRDGHRDFFPILCDFGTVQQEFHIGLASLATPGVVRGMFDIHREQGRMPLREIVLPAIELARQGVEMNALQAYIFRVVGGIYMSSASSRAIFHSPADKEQLIRQGEVFRNPLLADALESIAIEGDDLFYRGEIGQQIVKDCDDGGTLSPRDLENYTVIRRAPLVRDFQGNSLFTNPPPSSGGILIAFALSVLEASGLSGNRFGDRHHLEHMTTVMDLTNQVRLEHELHRLDEKEVAETLLDEHLITLYREKMHGHPRMSRGTTHISVVDGSGNAAALTISNGEGAGYVIPGTGIMMNNMLGEEDINPHGFHEWPLDVRMSSMMSPSMLLSNDGGLHVLGSGGSNRIRTAILQVLVNIVEYGMPLADAVHAPRLHYEAGKLNIEEGFDDDLRAAFAAPFDDARLWNERNLFFGGVHGVCAKRGMRGFDAVGDERRGGSATVL